MIKLYQHLLLRENMPTFSKIQFKIIKLIGDNGGCYSWETPLSPYKLWILAKANQIDKIVFHTTLKELEATGIIVQTNSKNGHKQIEFTSKGIGIFEAVDNSSGLNSSYHLVNIETFYCAEIEPDIKYVEVFSTNWGGELVHWLGDRLYECKVLDNSLFFCFVASQPQVFDWLAHSLFAGSYNIVLRELRHILEGLFASYLIEVQYSHETLEQKIDMLVNIEGAGKLHGKSVFKNSGLTEWEKYYTTYRQLSKYVHLSESVVEQQINRITNGGFSETYETHFHKQNF